MVRRIRHPIFARVYERVAPQLEARGAAEHRDEMLEGLSGRVVEIGSGPGLNFGHYPPSVTDVVAVEPEPRLRRGSEAAARDAPVAVTVVDGTADRVSAIDEEFDAGVASLVLCSVHDQAAALAELHRVIRSGGELRFYEHVQSSRGGLARAQRAADAVWPWFAGGCHTSRQTERAIGDAGFEIERIRRFDFRPSVVTALVAPHVVGAARRL